MKKSRNVPETLSVSKIVKSVVIGVLAGVLICTALLMICAGIFVAMERLPMEAISLLSIIILAVSAFFAGFISTKLCRGKGLLCGAISSLALFFIAMLAGLNFSVFSFNLSLLMKAVVMLIAGAIGGILAANKKVKIK